MTPSDIRETSSLTAAQLYPLWRRIGVNFTGASSDQPVDLEPLIIATASVASTDDRLTVCAVSWLAKFHDLVDGRRLSELARAASPRTRAYLGALLSWTTDAPDGARHAPQFATAISHCRPLRGGQDFYDSDARFPSPGQWMRDRSLPLFRHWHLWHDDATLQHKSIHALEHLLRVPELRIRALLGPSIEASCVSHTVGRVTNARALSKRLGVTYAATHAAVNRLVGRGLLQRTQRGVSQDLQLTDWCTSTLTAP